MQNQQPNIENQYKMLVVIWAALLMSQVMFLVLIFFVKPEALRFDFGKPFLGENPTMVVLLAFLGITTFLLSFVMKKKLLERAAANQTPALVQTAMVVACALCEATTLFGLLLVFLSAYQYFFLWFALAVLGMILHFPRREDLINASYKK